MGLTLGMQLKSATRLGVAPGGCALADRISFAVFKSAERCQLPSAYRVVVS